MSRVESYFLDIFCKHWFWCTTELSTITLLFVHLLQEALQRRSFQPGFTLEDSKFHYLARVPPTSCLLLRGYHDTEYWFHADMLRLHTICGCLQNSGASFLFLIDCTLAFVNRCLMYQEPFSTTPTPVARTSL